MSLKSVEKSKYSEKNTDHLMLSKFEEVFKCSYYTAKNDKLFGNLIPDGWFDYNDILFIMENKKSMKLKPEGRKQLINYYNFAKETEEFKKYKDCYLILGCGTKVLKYFIYSIKEDDISIIKKTLEDLKKQIDELKIIENKSNVFDQNIAHEFNQYLYDNDIKLSSDKIFFVIAILLCRKINPKLISIFNEKDNGFVIAEYLTKIIKDFYKDTLFSVSFNFIKYNLNNEYLYDLIKMLDFNINYYTNDILNQFYSEFMSYGEKSKDGVVLTPHDIVELMVKELDIKKGESVMDCCTGTGSFLIEASKYTDNLTGCEIKENLYSIVKGNFILHDLDINKIFHDNCFNHKFDLYDHIILNPPFVRCGDNGQISNVYGWREFNKEQKFIIYQLQYLKENGTGCFIIPRGNFNNTVQKTNKFKKVLLENCQILKIFNCNGNVFYPNASVECAIVVFKKCKNVEKYETEIIDYSNDGYTIKNAMRYKISDPNIKSYNITLNFNDDWNYNEQTYKKNFDVPNIKFITYKLLNDEHKFLLKQYESTLDYTSIIKEHIEIANKLSNLKTKELDKIIKIKMTDLLEYIQIKKYSTNEEIGDVPLYGATKKHRPVRFINNYSFDTSEAEDEITRENGIVMINNTGNGGAGLCFIHKGKFAILNTVTVFKMKQIIDPINIYYIGEQLHKLYNRANSFCIEKFNTQEINYIIFKQ